MSSKRLLYLVSLGSLASRLDAFLAFHSSFGHKKCCIPPAAPISDQQTRQQHTRTIGSRYRSSLKCPATKRQSISSNFQLPSNEFSRTVQPERVLKSRRDYVMDVEATIAERTALATRFDLTQIDSLQASLVLRPEGIRTTGVQVEGTVSASVVQTCVRTNEQFQVDVEFPLYCIVRPIRPLAQLLQLQDDENEYESTSRASMRECRSSQSSTRSNNKRKASYRPQDRSIEAMDASELQQLLQDDISSEESVLMEDEAIYSTDSLLDVGELVSQLFWLQLDPYPKKPGSEPIQTTITG